MDYLKDKRGYFWLVFDRNKSKCAAFMTNLIAHFILSLKGVETSRSAKFWGIPFVKRFPMSRIIIGKHCRFNSLPKSQEIYISEPCTFVTAAKGAEITIGNNVGCTSTSFVVVKKVTIGDNVLLGYNTTVSDTDFHHSDPRKRHLIGDSRPVEIQKNVYVGMNSVILKGVTIGENSAIGANSVVFTSIPPNSIAIGNPCKVIMRKKWDT